MDRGGKEEVQAELPQTTGPVSLQETYRGAEILYKFRKVFRHRPLQEARRGIKTLFKFRKVFIL